MGGGRGGGGRLRSTFELRRQQDMHDITVPLSAPCLNGLTQLRCISSMEKAVHSVELYG